MRYVWSLGRGTVEKEVRGTVRAPRVRRAPDRQVHAIAQVAAGGGGLARFFKARRARRILAQPRPARPAVPRVAEIAPARDGRGGRGAERAGNLRRGAAPLRFREAPVAVRVVRQFRPQTARDRREPAARTQPSAPSVSAAAGGASAGRGRADGGRNA